MVSGLDFISSALDSSRRPAAWQMKSSQLLLSHLEHQNLHLDHVNAQLVAANVAFVAGPVSCVCL